ncbi:hypothetical protein DITRI_Ditri07aG0046800 [Diplodiscus trichospermus]
MSAVEPTAACGNQNDAVDMYLKSGGIHGLFSRIELSFFATNLQDRDVFSKSDLTVVVYIKERWSYYRSISYRSSSQLIESYMDDEVIQTLLFHVFDVETQFHNVEVKMPKLEEQQSLGEASCALSEIVTKPNRLLTLQLVRREESVQSTHSQHHGKLTVHAGECFSSKITAEITFKDPFLVISKLAGSGISIPVCKTEILKNDLSPTWQPLFLNIRQFGSKDSPLVIECFNFSNNGKHDLNGKVNKSLVDLEKLHSGREGENLFLPTLVGHDYQNKRLKSKTLVDKFSETIQYTFLDYLAGGFELNFMVAIDFTASNGKPRLSDLLHYIDLSGRQNAYQKANYKVGEVLQFYEYGQAFSCLGIWSMAH